MSRFLPAAPALRLRPARAAWTVRPLPMLTAVACALAAIPGAGRAQIVSNGSFESPAIPTNSYCFAGEDASPYTNCNSASVNAQAWTFVGGSGFVNGGGSLSFGAPTEPDGAQAAFLQSGSYQGNPPGRISQSVTLATVGMYRLTFYAAGRTGGQTFDGNTIFDALLGTTTLGTFTTTTGSAFTQRTALFSAAAGTYNLAFAFNASQPDLLSTTFAHTFFLDAVQITPVATTVPEPGTWALLAAGLGGVGLFARRRARV